VALIGRNGVGKSSLLDVLSGDVAPTVGRVVLNAKPVLVSQELGPGHPTRALDLVLASAGSAGLTHEELSSELSSAGLRDISELQKKRGFSLGEARTLHLLAAKIASPELLILDEPTQDLDEDGSNWLRSWLKRWQLGLILVSHDRRLLSQFRHFFLVAESGCRYWHGTFTELEATLEQDEETHLRRYLRRLNVLLQREQHSERFRRRRERKKNVGRVRELGRMTPRSRLNQKRSYAQEKQGRIAGIRKDRISTVRAWAKAARRALSVRLPLEVVTPRLPETDGGDLIVLDGVSCGRPPRPLFTALNLRVGRDRVAVVGPNGAGKTTLLRVMLGTQEPTDGRARRQTSRIGAIAQAATDWMSEESLLEHLARVSDVSSPDHLAALLVAHRFPFALAERPMASLSPGERVRAALICLFQRQPPAELLVLDEPTYALDWVGATAMRAALRAWPGGLVVASHDRELLYDIGVARHVVLDDAGRHRIES
jgi:ATPase subunit of ABC transporter with duplicated ATPase domains